MKLSRYVTTTEPFEVTREGATGPAVIAFSGRSGQSVLLPLDTYNSLLADEFDGLSADVLATLVNGTFIVPRDERELDSVLEENRASVADDQRLNCVIYPTDKCNFGCDELYCGQEHGSSDLSEPQQDRYLQLVRERLDRHRFTELSVGWFGGEPLLGLPVIERMAPRLYDWAAADGIEYTSTITTNGYTLDIDTATSLVRRCHVEFFQITLDGSREYHDKRRCLKGGGPTYDTILSNLRALVTSDLNASVMVRCNVDAANVDGVLPLLDDLARLGIQDKLSDFYADPVHHWGEHVPPNILPIEEFAEREVDWLARMVQLGFKTRFLPHRKRTTCIAVRNSSLVVAPTGDLYSCVEPPLTPRENEYANAELALPVLQAGAAESDTYSIGHVDRGVIEERRARLASFYDRVGAGDYPCHDCSLLPVCGGACPKHWLDDIPPCPSAKFNLPERLLLDYAVQQARENGDR